MNSYTRIIQEISSKISSYEKMYDTNQTRYYYRGQSVKDRKLIPSICRPGVTEAEQQVIRNAQQNGEWDNARSLFDNIAHLQHYERPTRFLDYSTDINIALYFACSGDSHIDQDGEIWICAYDERRMSHVDSALIAELCLLDEKLPVSRFVDCLLKKHPELKIQYQYPDDLGMQIISWIDHGFMVTPTNSEYESMRDWNPRLYNQKGAFFVFGNKTELPIYCASTAHAKTCIMLPEIADSPPIINFPRAMRIIISHEDKESILETLSLKGINESYIYPNL